MYNSYLLQSPFSCYSHIVSWVAINPEQSLGGHLILNKLNIFIHEKCTSVSRFGFPYLEKNNYELDIQVCIGKYYLPRKKATYISEENRVKNWKVNIFTVKLFSVAANERVFSAGAHSNTQC